MTSLQQPREHESRYYTSQTYLLPSDNEEAQRLYDQQKFTLKLYENRIVLAPVRLGAESQVLDVGTGSGAWALDLVEEYPTIGMVHCVDIGSRLFPVDHPSNMTFATASVLALSTEWGNKFNLVHQRLLMAALKYDDWAVAAREIFRVTAPGGWAELCEINAQTTICGPSSAKLLQIWNRLGQHNHMDFEISVRLRKLLSEAGFADVEVERRVVKFGPAGGEVGRKFAHNVLDVGRGMKAPIFLAGGLDLVTNEKEYDTLLDEVTKEWEGELGSGAEYQWFIFTARKPE